MTAVVRGIVLFAHGSRDPLWHRPLQAVEQLIRQRDSTAIVQCGYLELTQPDLAGAVARLVEAGVRHVTVVPMFLGVGKHAREDLPRLMELARLQFPELSFALQPAVSEDPRLLDQLAMIALG